MTVHENITELIGHTPLVELTNYERAHELPATLIGKVESFNPTGSVKDRAAQSMIDAAVEAGVLDDETVIIEPTSGNTGHRRRAGQPHHHRHARDHVRGAAQPHARLRGGARAH